MSRALAPRSPAARRITVEIWVVLALSLGQSGVYAIVDLIDMLTRPTPLGQQSATLNASLSSRPVFDLVNQGLSIVFTLAPVALVLYLLALRAGPTAVLRDGAEAIGLTARSWREAAADVGRGALLAAAIGIPGLAFLAIGRQLGITVGIQAAAIGAVWYAVPVLIARAAMNAILEEAIAVGYLAERLGDLRWRLPAILAASAVLRGSYHLYQGIGPFFGNLVMGLAFAWLYMRRAPETGRGGRPARLLGPGGRTLPLVAAHTIMDVVAFVGYAVAPAGLLAALGIA